MKFNYNLIKIITIVLILFSFFLSVSHTIYATNEDLANEVAEENENRFSQGSPWMDNIDENVYSNHVDTEEEDQQIEPKKPGSVEKYLSELIRNAASSLISLLEENLNAGIDRVIYGRVGSGKPNSVNIYGFELRSGNPYGVTASVSYSLVRSMAFVLIGISFVFLLAKSAWTGQTAQSRDKVKTGFYSTGIKFAMLTLMPYLFDVGLYIRDIILYGIKDVTGQMITGGATLSLSKAFLLNAERTGRFIDSLMYLGTVLLTLYFVIIYIATAIDLLICFVSFPVLCLMHSPKKDLLSGWLMNVLSNLLTPVLDAILLLIPLLTSLMLADTIKGIAIIQMIMCMLIIPSRNRIKSLLGIQSNERGGLLGIMALATMGKALVGKVKGAFGRAADVYSDARKSKMHKELAEVDEEERTSLLNGRGEIGGASRGLQDNILDSSKLDESQSTEEIEDIENLNTPESGLEGVFEERDNGVTGNIADNQSVEILEDLEDGIVAAENTADFVANDNRYQTEDTAHSKNEQEVEQASEAINIGESRGIQKELIGREPHTKNDVLRNLDNAMEQKQKVIDALRMQRAKYKTEEKQKAHQMLDYDRDSEEYRELEKQKSQASVQVAETDQKISEQMSNLNQLRLQAADIKGSQKGRVPSSVEEAKADIICKRANINNFEQPEFKNVLSHEQMSKLYRKRAGSNLLKGSASLAGAAVGTAVVGGGSLFMQPSVVAMSTVAGALGGSALGNGVAGIGMAGARGLKKVAQGSKNSYDMKRQGDIIDMAIGTDIENTYGSIVNTEPIKSMPMQYAKPVINYQNMERRSKDALEINLEKDSIDALQKVITTSGGFKSSSGLLALEKANIETEKHFIELREKQNITLTQKQERLKRIELQTEYLAEEVLKNLSLQTEYEKGTANYNEAKEVILGKVRSIIEKQNKNIF